MQLDSQDEYLRNSLDAIMRGEWDAHFRPEQLEMAKKMSFMLNHIRLEGTKISFEYEGCKLKYGMDCDLSDLTLYSGDAKQEVMSMIRNDEYFLTAYRKFVRDWKISKIIES